VSTGKTRLLARLPRPLMGACAVALGGQVYVAGGSTAAGTTDQVWRVDPALGTVTLAGRLPYAVAYAAAAVVGGTGYLVGGTNRGGATLATAVSLTLT
jgi:N-acetylneuraminic acid mutarotase